MSLTREITETVQQSIFLKAISSSLQLRYQLDLVSAASSVNSLTAVKLSLWLLAALDHFG